MMPSQANVAGNIHGGEIIKLMDSTAYAAARRFARTNVVTARVDELEFHLPIFIGDLVICTAQVVYAGRSSMEVAVNVEVEDLEHEGRQKALSAFFTMVAIDKKGRPSQVAELILDTPEEKAAFEEGKRRYEFRKAKKNPNIVCKMECTPADE
ncbi:MAG: acyl-CoA thioesterase [Sporomusaceae bacterium]|nr:acyl-CoA thioesterase [Sporomusaceae bacterium]